MNLEMLHRRRLIAEDLSMYEPETIKYMNEIHVRHSETDINYAGTPQEKTGKQLWGIVDTYVKGLKAASLWDKIKLDYPMIGGTPESHAINIVDPDEYTVSWYGGWVHDHMGATGNGLNTFGDTHFIPADNMELLNNGLTLTVNSNRTPLYGDVIELGAQDYEYFNTKAQLIGVMFASRMNGGYYRVSNPDYRGIYTATRTAAVTKMVKNGVILATKVASGEFPPGVPLGIGNVILRTNPYNVNSNGPSNQTITSVLDHEGLTDPEMVTLHSLISQRESALNRKTW